MGECPICGSPEAVALGTLGRIYWVRCRHCGTDYQLDSAQLEELEV